MRRCVVLLALLICVGCATHAKRSAEADPWQALVEGNHRFMRGERTARDVVARRRELAQGQHPRAAILACADSRVAPELLFDADLGEVFVVRTAGNVADTVAVASLEYAVEHLHVGLLVVLGHEKCGAVAAAQGGEKMPTASLQALVTQIAPALAEAPKDAGEMGPVEANVRHSARDILAKSAVLKHEADSGALKVVLAVYRLESGEVVPLP